MPDSQMADIEKYMLLYLQNTIGWGGLQELIYFSNMILLKINKRLYA